MAKRKPAKTRADSAEERADAFVNALTGIGTTSDRRRSTTVAAPIVLTTQDMADIYRGNGLGRRIVDRRVDDATRHWCKITNDEDDKVSQRLEEIGMQRSISKAWKTGRLHGGAIGLILVDDGGRLEEPVNEKRIRAVNGMVVFDRRDMFTQMIDINRDVNSGRFMMPDLYEILPMTGGESFRVHHSRCVRFDGDEIGWREYQRNNYWHDSVLQVAFDALRQFGAVLDSAEFIVEQFVINILKMPGLMALLKQKDNDTIRNRLKLLDQSMHTANHAMIDAAEEYQRVVSTVAGLPDLVDQFMMSLSASTGYPVTLLFGRSPAGMNATGESDITLYYDTVAADQRNVLKPELEKVVRYTFLSLGGEPEQWSIVFNPLRQMSEIERSTLYKTTAEGDAIYLANSCISPEALAKHRFVGEEFDTSPPTISEEEWDEEERLREEENEQELERMKAAAAQQPPPGQSGQGQAPEQPQEGDDEE